MSPDEEGLIKMQNYFLLHVLLLSVTESEIKRVWKINELKVKNNTYFSL
jgi:hypothetical protein